jgi:hypothetical protein
MSKITAQRTYFNDCTLSRVRIDGIDFQCFLIGLPWLGNEQEESCIPEGEYEYEVKESPRLGRPVIWILNVPNRTNIQWHPANYTRQLLGCEAPGDSIKFLDDDGTPDVTNSTKTLDKLLSVIDKTGTINIVEQHKPRSVYDVG